MSEKFKYLILALLLVFLLIPRPASAFIVGDIISFLDHMASAIEEMAEPMVQRMFDFLIFYAVGIISLGLSTLFLQTAINNQSAWLTNLHNMTLAGWNFTSGLANMLLVLVFLVIAFAFILKIETFQAKKTLPKLIIVALLLNFSLLFVQMLFDIAQIVYKTILEAGGGNLFITVMNVFVGGGMSVLIGILAWVAAIGAAWAVPFVHPFFQILYVSLFGIVFLPNIAIWFFQTICFFTLAGMFGLFTFLFAARVFIIQMLAMLAPLAFLCLILPQTQKWWSEWFKHLIEWLTLGIFWLFFLVLGFKGIGLLAPEMAITEWRVTVPFPGFAWAQIGQYVFYYFCIFTYLAIILYLSKKYRPALSQALIDFGKQVGGLMWSRGLKPFSGAMWEEMRRATVFRAPGAREKAEAKAARGERLGFGEKLALTGFGKGLEKVSVGTVRGISHWVYRTTPEEDLMKEMSEAEKKGAEIKDPNLLIRDMKAAIRTRNEAAAIGLVSTGIEKGGIFKKRVSEELLPEEAAKLGLAANTMKAGKEAERIGRGFAHKLKDEDLQAMGFELKTEDTEKGFTTIRKKLIGESKGKEIEDFAKELWKSDAAMEIVHLFWDGHQIGDAAREFGRAFTQELQKTAHDIHWYFEIDPNTGKIRNPALPRYMASSAAQAAGITPLKGGETPADLNQLMAAARSRITPPAYVTPEQEEAAVNEIRATEGRLRSLRSEPMRTRADEEEIAMLEAAIEDIKKKLRLGTLPPISPLPPPSPPSKPTTPPEVPQSWVAGPRGKWGPPPGYVPPTHTHAERNAMATEVNRMTRELNRLRKLPVRSDEDDEAMRMLEATIRDIRQRLGK